MNYELSKKLQEAGYPFPFINDMQPIVLRPTLEELIEACGDNFVFLQKKMKESTWTCLGMEHARHQEAALSKQ